MDKIIFSAVLAIGILVAIDHYFSLDRYTGGADVISSSHTAIIRSVSPSCTVRALRCYGTEKEVATDSRAKNR